DHTFFFFNYEGDRFRSFAFAGKMTLPTAAMKSGDFSSWLGSQVGTDALGRPVFSNEIYDPTTTRNVTAGQVDTKTGLTANADAVIRDPFSSGGNLNIIPAAEFSNATSVLLPMIPDPSLPGNINNAFRLNGCCPILSRNAYTGKIDHVLTSRQKLGGPLLGIRETGITGTTAGHSCPFPDNRSTPLSDRSWVVRKCASPMHGRSAAAA